jgi:hypothetical protein
MKIQDWVIKDEAIVGKKLVTIPNDEGLPTLDKDGNLSPNFVKHQYLSLYIQNIGEREWRFEIGDRTPVIIYNSIVIDGRNDIII